MTPEYVYLQFHLKGFSLIKLMLTQTKFDKLAVSSIALQGQMAVTDYFVKHDLSFCYTESCFLMTRNASLLSKTINHTQ